jgi:dihydrofolate reductase
MGFKGNNGNLRMEKIIIVAVADNGVIGNGPNEIPWRKTKGDREKYSADMDRFVDLTRHNAITMGRETYLSIPRKFRPLDKGRTSIVLTSQRYIENGRGGVEGGMWIASSLDESEEIVKQRGHDKLFLAGGVRVYKEGLKIANRMEITRIKGEFEGDKRFPEVDWNQWNKIGERDQEDLYFVSYLRK